MPLAFLLDDLAREFLHFVITLLEEKPRTNRIHSRLRDRILAATDESTADYEC